MKSATHVQHRLFRRREITTILLSVVLFLALGAWLLGFRVVYGYAPRGQAPTGPDELAHRVIELTNLERRAAGLSPLKANEQLSRAAKAHALAMAEHDFFAHENPVTGSTLEARARAEGYVGALAENIALGQPTPEDVVVSWMNSEGHRANILGPDYREIGMGYVRGPGPSDACQNPPCQHYWTQVFGLQADVFPIIINDEAARTDEPEVALYIYGQGWAQEMRLKNDNEPFGAWIPYATEMTWRLPEQEGAHTVTVELRNAAGEVRSALDEIYLRERATAPTGSGVGQNPTAQHTPMPPAGGEPVRLERFHRPESLYTQEEVEVRLMVTGSSLSCGEVRVRTPLDIALVLDYSGSMNDFTASGSEISKLDAAKAAAKTFLDAVELGADQVAIIGFDNYASLYQSLTTDGNTLVQAIDRLQGGGGTNIADGILAGMDELTGSRRRQDAQGVIILLSDGQSAAQGAAQQAKSAGLRIVTIGLGADVDEAELQAIASTPEDYYFSPDASQLESIFAAIAENIQQRPAARDLTLTHRFDVTNFEVIPDSIEPQGELRFDRIIWRIPNLGDEVLEFTYRARSRIPGQFDLDLGDRLEYLECGERPRTITLGSGLPVEVAQNPNITPTPLPTPPPEPLTPEEQAYNFLCGDFPWWWLLPLALFLILLAMILLANFRGWREDWTSGPACPLCCVLGHLLFIAFLFFLFGLLLKALQPTLCQPSAAIYFWEVTPDQKSNILYKPIDPDLPVREFKALNAQADCIACHSVALREDVIAAIADGSNGPVTIMRLDGTLISSGAIHATYVAVSPDGKQLAYAKEGKDIYIYDIESGLSVPLKGASDPAVVETMPTWSPDGKTIAFVRAEGEVRGYKLAVPSDIYTVPASGGLATMLPGAGGVGFNYYPAYSPDGRWLAFTRHTTGESTYGDPQAEIYLVPAQGGAPIRLQANDLPGGQTLAGVSNSWPTWSPDGRWLAFNTKRNAGQFDIYITQIDPSGNSGPARPLTGAARLDRFEHLPQWGRPPRPDLLSNLLRVLPWLLGVPLLWLLKRWLCRPKVYSHTIALKREVSPLVGPKDQGAFNVRLTLEPKAEDCERQRIRHAVDVILVLDVSPSMDWKTAPVVGEQKLKAAQRAAKAFVNAMDAKQDRVGLIVFDDEARIVYSLDAEGNIEAAIDSLEAGGEGTAIHAGLQAAFEEMYTFRRADTPGVIVLLSDGGSEPVPAIEVAQWIKNEGLRLITIGFGMAADKKLLQQLATMPQDYHSSAGGQQLKRVFLAIAEELGEPISATDIEFNHRVNVNDFDLDEGSIYPQPSQIKGGVITWTISDLMVPRTFRYQVTGTTVGEDLAIDLGDRVRYKRCGEIPMEYEEEPGLEVTVTEPPPPKEIVRSIKPPEPLPIPERKPVWDPDAVLIVGVGMFGRKVLTHLKKNLRDAGAGDIPDRVQFLLLDTAKYLATDKPLVFAGVSLADEEVVVLDENLDPVIREMVADSASHPELRPWFVAEDFGSGAAQTKTLAAGTHGKRPLARAAFVRMINGKTLVGDEPLPDRLRRLLRLTHTEHGVRVILVGSLSEGMSGVLWDMAYLTREFTRMELGETTVVAIEGYLGMETRGDNPNEPATDAELNAIVALRELTWFQLNPGFNHSITYGSKEIDEELKPLRQRLIDDLYLFPSNVKTDEIGEEGETPALADFITLRLDRENIRGWDKDWFQVIRNEVQAKERAERRLYFGTGGSFALRLPVYDLMEAIKVRWAREMIQGFLMGQRRESLEFATKYMADPALPLNPGALVDGFLTGFEEGDRLYTDEIAPEALKALGWIWRGRVKEAQDLTLETDAPRAIQTYLAAILQLLLMGADSEDAEQPRAGKIAYATEFLQALRIVCEGDLKESIAKAAVAEELREQWEQSRKALLEQVIAHLERMQETKDYLGQVYAALNTRGQEIEAWRKRMDAIEQRCYVWEQWLAPDGKRLPLAKALADLWYEQVYAKARPEAFGNYLIWETTAEGRVDLQLLMEKDAKVSSLDVDADEFASHLLAFAEGRIRWLWEDVASLTDVAEDAMARLAGALGRDYKGAAQTNWRAIANELARKAQPTAHKQKLFKPEAHHFSHRRYVWAAAPIARSESLNRLLEALESIASGGQTEWKDLEFSDPLIWQLLHTVDVLTIEDLWRHPTIWKALHREEDSRTVWDWEFVARRMQRVLKRRPRPLDHLLHPVVAVALREREQASLYSLAIASEWVVEGRDGWGIYPHGESGQALLTWRSIPGWDPRVYGLLHVTFRAEQDALDKLREELKRREQDLLRIWQTFIRQRPYQEQNESDDSFSLRILAWMLTQERIQDIKRSQIP